MMDVVSQIWNGEYSNSKLKYKKIKNKLIDEWIINKLTTTKDNIERIRIVRQNSEVQIALVKESIEEHLHSKSCAIAEELRQRGNECYKKRNLKGALRGYNLSLCFSPEGESVELTLAYANRSACFLELNRIEDCLKDIEFSWTAAGFDDEEKTENENLKKKLVERRKKCEDRKEANGLTSAYRHELKLPPEFTLKTENKIIPSAEEFITIEDHPDRGRHVRVTKDVLPGTLLIVEDPLAKILVKHLLFNADRCDYCQAKLYDCGIPCNQCVFVMYCNENCSSEGHRIHEYECRISSPLHNMGLSRILLLALRIITKLGPEELYKFWKENSKPGDKNGQILGFNSDGIYSSSDYLTIFNLIYHDDVLAERELFQYSFESIIMIDLVKKHSNYFNVPKYECVEEKEMFMDFVTSLLLLHQMNLPCNAHSLNELQLANYGHPTRNEIKAGVTNEYGACAFSLLSLINHSCDPNVTRITLVTGENAVVAIRIIKGGDEIWDNYGPHYAIENYGGRQKHLKGHYNFHCGCPACEFRWPSVIQMKTADKNVFTCMSCRESLSMQSDYKEILKCVIDSKENCPRCNKNYYLTVLEAKLESYGAKFNVAYELVLENKGRESVPNLVECLFHFESQMLPPYVYTNYSQETLKQAFNLINLNYS